ncbi:hypothetical protein IQ17_01913 [Bradyrhizobium daqingense]|uniref:Uncharacterized protein n=1 Tax=Bradyrhizobium daqingense TaxID=993502 RepID=A0A562LIZ9_9BRAD|nr:hypothetical protein IQ17_01913 [Bradyrhizobium daqingense]
MSGKLNRRNVRQFRAPHYVSAIWAISFTVMAGLVPAIHASPPTKDVDARVKPGHDDGELARIRLYNVIAPHGISYTTILSAMPRKAACFWIGLIARCSSTSATAGASSTGPVIWISCAVDRLCTRAAMLTVWPK